MLEGVFGARGRSKTIGEMRSSSKWLKARTLFKPSATEWIAEAEELAAIEVAKEREQLQREEQENKEEEEAEKKASQEAVVEKSDEKLEEKSEL